MSEFGDISRMKLSELERKGYDPGQEEIADPDSGEAEETKESGAMPALAGEAAEEAEPAEGSEVEVAEEEAMPEPVGTHYYIDAKTTAREMTAFLFAHNYRSPLMILATLVGLVWPIYTVIRSEGSVLVAVVCALVFLVFMPFSIWRRGTTSVSQNPLYKNTFHYMLDEKGLHLKLAEHLVNVDWSQVTRTMYLKTSTVLYTGKINAYLIPTEAMGDKKDEINRFVKSHVASGRMR